MNFVYENTQIREQMRHRGLSVVQQPQYRWDAIGQRYLEELEIAYSGEATKVDVAEECLHS